MDASGLFLIWLLLAAGVGMLANSRGRGFVGYALLSVLLSPLVGLIVVLVSRNLIEEEARQAEQRREHERQLESIKAIAGAHAPDPAAAAPDADRGSVADELEKLAGLVDRGVLTRDEFDRQKASLLSRS